MSDFRGCETYKVTGLPVSGATADIWDAVLGTPGGAPTATTTTDSNGWWSFTGLTDVPKDVRVTFSGAIRWYKGLTRVSAERVHHKESPWYDPVSLVKL